MIIDIIKNKYPFPRVLVLEPVVDEVEYVGLGVLSARDLDSVCNFSVAFLEMRFVARINPENPGFR